MDSENSITYSDRELGAGRDLMPVERLLVLSTTAVIAACAAVRPDPNRPITAACDQTVNCFYERDIRDFRALDSRTVIVFVGRDECPFKLEVDGFSCDLTVSALLSFEDDDGRICVWDQTVVRGGPFPLEGDYCRLQRITPLTDDELLEEFAISGIAPPLPAKGSGEIEVIEADAPQDAAAEPISAEPEAAASTEVTEESAIAP